MTTLLAHVTSLTNIVKAIATVPVTINQITKVSCVYTGEGHMFDNCPQNPTSVNNVGNFNRQKHKNPYSNTYNPRWI